MHIAMLPGSHLVAAAPDGDDDALGGGSVAAQHVVCEGAVHQATGQGNKRGGRKHGAPLWVVKDLQEAGLAAVDVLHRVEGALLNVACLALAQLDGPHRIAGLLTANLVYQHLACGGWGVGAGGW